jgi:hypothetical protein
MRAGRVIMNTDPGEQAQRAITLVVASRDELRARILAYLNELNRESVIHT